MRIPLNQAVIPVRKLTHYLLVSRDVDDKSQYLAQAGFVLENYQLLDIAIRNMLQENEALPDGENEFGEYYSVTGYLTGPNGRRLYVETIWIIKLDIDDLYRFVTLKPSRPDK